MGMELKIEEFQVTPEIKFNFEELREQVAEKVSFYKDLVYTDSEMRQAKADRAALRKFVEAIDARRKEIKAEVMAPYTALEVKLDEIKAIVQEPINMIDNRVKAYEELQKETKTESIHQGWINKGGPFGIDLIWNPKWLNTTYSMKKIGEEMDAAIETYNNGMTTLEQLTEYQFEAIEVFKATLDLGAAMVRANELKEQARRKAEYEAEKERLRMKEQAEPHVDWKADSDPLADPSQVTWPEETKRTWIKFEAYMSVEEALALRDFFVGNNIEFRKGE